MSQVFLEVSTELLSRGYKVRFRADGTSMNPTIRNGEAITVEPVSPEHLELGDIALYRTDWGRTFAHRLVGIENREGGRPVFLARGDAPGSQPERVESQQVLGKVVTVERGRGAIDLAGRRAKMKHSVRRYSSRILNPLHCLYRSSRHCLARLLAKPAVLFVLLLFGLLPGRLAADIHFVRVVGTPICGATPEAVTVATAIPVGDFLIVTMASSTTNTGFAIADNNAAHNTFTQNATTTATPSPQTLIFSAPVINALPAAGTITASWAGGRTACISVLQFGGITSPTLDRAGVVTAAHTSTAPSVSTTATTQAYELIIGAVGAANATVTLTQTAGYNAAGGIADTRRRLFPMWQISQTTGIKTAGGTLNSSQSWGAVMATYKGTNTTAVTSRSFTATAFDNGSLVQLQTSRDVNNLGFNLYREQNGQRIKLNSSLLAGSALQAGADTALTAGSSHTWFDDRAGASRGVSYWVEEIDLNGARTWFGPATPQASGGSPPRTLKAMPLSRMGTITELSSRPVERRAGMTADFLETLQPLIRSSSGGRSSSRYTQWTLAAGKGIRIGIQSEGWYRIALSDLVAAGLDPTADPRNFQLFADGVEQPILVQGNAIEFYGTGLDTTWSDTRVYWLTAGTQPGMRVRTAGSMPGASAGPASFPFAIQRQDRTVYFAALRNGDADNFFGPAVTGDPVGQTLNVTRLAGGSSQLRISLQGATAGPHAVAVQLNGREIGAVSFEDQSLGESAFDLSNGQLREGANIVTLASQGGDSDVSLVDSVELTYPHAYTADNDRLRFSASGGQSVRIGGFRSSNIRVVDITDASAARILPAAVTQSGDTFEVATVSEGRGDRILLAFGEAQIGRPVSMTANRPSSWHQQQPGADMVMIGHATLLPSLAPLKTLRESQGHTVAMIDVQDLYDEFSFGHKSPYAIQDFLLAAQSQWQRKPRFVLLAGDATFDPRNYLGFGDFDFVPTKLVETAVFETASDDWFADFKGDGIPQMAIGRLPVRTAAEAAAVVSKIVGHEQSAGGGVKNQALVVAGTNDDENDFESYSNAVKALLPARMGVTQINGGRMTGDQAHAQLLQSLNNGQALVNYIGHGSTEVLAGGLLSSADVASLTNGRQLPFFVSMTCLNGYFQDVYTESLAKTLVNAGNGGAVAAFASSGMTASSEQAILNQALIQALYSDQPMTIGEAVGIAKKATSDQDVRRTWILFGDPATRLQ